MGPDFIYPKTKDLKPKINHQKSFKFLTENHNRNFLLSNPKNNSKRYVSHEHINSKLKGYIYFGFYETKKKFYRLFYRFPIFSTLFFKYYIDFYAKYNVLYTYIKKTKI